ncbi:MAG: FAD-dependent oxidoreductase [Acidimicrobiales bacterium]
MKTVLILGAGFAGLELATVLSNEVPGEVDITIVDSHDAFVFGFSKLDLLFGRTDLAGVRVPYAHLDKPGVRFVQETILAIDPERRRVTTDASTYDPDILVVALGADLDPAATPGMVEEGTEFYSVEGAARVGERLPDFAGGDVIIGVLGNFFKCPAAPFETAFMLHDFLEQRSVRATSSIKIVSPMGTPIPISPEASAGILEAAGERDIEWCPQSKVTALEPASRTATLEDGRTMHYDLFLGIPVHRAPRVVEESALAEDGWIPVDHRTFATKFEDVYAVGDVTSAPVPRVGAIAEGEARTLAEVLIHQIRGGDAPAPYQGTATCYIEFGGARVARFDANFLSGPTPFGSFTPASEEIVASKVEFGASRRRRWFGVD